MGCGYSQNFINLYNTLQYQEWNKTFHALQISKAEVYRLHRTFGKVDLDNSGTIDVVELLTVIDVDRTPFSERVFSIFDEDKSGKIDFYEFVLSLWNYCTLSRVTLAMFAFDLYDRDSSGFLEEKDIYLMLKDVYGKDINSHYAKQTRRDLEEFIEKKGDIDLDRFLKFVQYHHSLLFPAFQMQLGLKKNILGVRFWEKCSERRVKLSNQKYITIKEILELQAIQAKADSMKGVLVSTNTGKLAIQSLGIAHDRRLKYSNSSSEKDDILGPGVSLIHTDPSMDSHDGPSGGDPHGKSHQSLNSLINNDHSGGHPHFETIGTISQRGSHKPSHRMTSVKTNTNTTLLDNLMNPHASSKSTMSMSHHHIPHVLHSVKEEAGSHHHHHHHNHHNMSRKDHHHPHNHHASSSKSPPRSPAPSNDHHHNNHHHSHNQSHGKIASNKIVPINENPRVKSPPIQEKPAVVKEDMDLIRPSKKNHHGTIGHQPHHNRTAQDLKSLATPAGTTNPTNSNNNVGKGHARRDIRRASV